MSVKLSVIAACFKEPYLNKVILDLLNQSELGDKLEVIAVFDGPDAAPDQKTLIQDPRVRYVFLGKNSGPKAAYNAGIAVSRGEFFMRLDAHCIFGKGYDRIMTESCAPNQIMTARRYYLDPIKWEVMVDQGYIDYEKLVIQDVGNGVRKFAGQKWITRTKERKDIMVDETMAMQGSMWIAPRKWFDEICGGELMQGRLGPAYQDSVQVSMQTWQAGGQLMVNKNTWFAHKHRSFARTHQEGGKENPWNREESWKYSLELWEKYYTDVLKPLWKI